MFFPGLTPVSSGSRTVFSVEGISPLPTINDLSISSQKSGSSSSGSPSKKRSRAPPLPFRLWTEDEEKLERERAVAGTSSGFSAGAVGGCHDDEPESMVTTPTKLGVSQSLKRRSSEGKDATTRSIMRLLAFGDHIPKEAAKKFCPEGPSERDRQSEVHICFNYLLVL